MRLKELKLNTKNLFPTREGEGSSEKGMTLLEIIIVIALIGSLMAVLVSSLTSRQDEAMVDNARIAMANIAQSLQLYRVHVNRYPTGPDGLKNLVENVSGNKKWRGPYIEEGKLYDPWGEPFTYESADGRNFKIICAGINGQIGDEDDLTYPEE